MSLLDDDRADGFPEPLDVVDAPAFQQFTELMEKTNIRFVVAALRSIPEAVHARAGLKANNCPVSALIDFQPEDFKARNCDARCVRRHGACVRGGD